ncbi:MAG TPA: hypothetical protein VI336_02945, partial [Candidatus Saccharimonadales bacterium]|nr:hypothetical protein [Candidatus Saccharimonadales bacterium]
IQNFLNSKVPTCDTNGSEEYNGSGMTRAEWAEANDKPEPPYKCLKSYTQNIPSRAADSYCNGSVAGGTKNAARIIYDVAKACDINPKVLIVTLQKEQSLVTDDWPWPVQYQKAMGYGCPDTAPCDPDFAGFFNQVWYAARQFQRYKAQPEFYNYESQQRSFVAYNPQSSCDGSKITMFNNATAGLYNYTPYQPNSAALANLYGSAPPCGAYGNRNFWRMFSDWFGNTLIDTSKDKVIVGDWDGDDTANPAIKRGNTYFFDHDNDGEADVSYSWGKSTDRVIVGDWDGDGADEIGLKRGREYFLDYENNASSNVYVSWGKPTDSAIVGDWDGDGADELGLKRGNQYFLDYDNNGSSNVSYAWGKPTDKVMVGKWGLSKDGLGLRRGSEYFLDYDNNASSNKSYSWGKATDVVIYGSWDADIADEIGLKRSSNYFLDYGNNGSSDESFVYTY